MNGLYVSGLGALTGSVCVAVSDSVTRGDYDAREAQDDGYGSVVVEPNRSCYELAAVATQRALADADASPESVSLLCYASIHRHGQPRLWSPASWVQRELKLPSTIPTLAIQQGCNALTQCLSIVSALPAGGQRLLIGADCFSGSGFDRHRSDYGLIYGDAACAVLLSERTGFAMVLSVFLDGVPELEELHRDEFPRDENEASFRDEYDVRRAKKRFLSRYGKDGFLQPLNQALWRLRSRLVQSDTWTGKADWLIPPFVGDRVRHATYEAVFGELAEQCAWQIGRTLGHLGVSDAWVGLAELRRSGALAPGDRVLMITAGVGFSCGAILLQIQP